MSRRLLKALGATTVVMLTATLLGVVPAQADGDGHFNSSATVDVEPGGSASVISPSMDKSMDKAKVEAQAPESDGDGFEEVALTMLQQPTPGRRIMACVAMATRALRGMQSAILAGGTLDQMEEFEASADSFLLVRVAVCVHLAQLVAEVLAEQSVRPRLAGSRCGRATVAIKEKITRRNGKFRLTVKSAKVGSKYARVKVNCKVVSPTKVSTTITPKKDGSTLRKALASKNLGTGLGSPSSAAEGARVKVSFKAP